MQGNWKRLAASLAEAIRQEPVYKNWLQARADVEERHAAKVMLRDLQQAQAELMEKMQKGESISEEEQTRWQKTVETVAYNPYVAALLQAEAALAALLTEVNEELAKQLGVTPESAGHIGAAGPEDEMTGGQPSRLWVPGR